MKKQEDTQKTEKLNKEAEVWKAKYLRALADYQNLEKRVASQNQQLAKYASERVIIKLLGVVDILEKAQEHIKDKGLTLAIDNFKVVLRQENVVRLDVVNKVFNPHEMECIEVVESDKEDIVLEEVRAGYKMHDKVIRVAQVKVGKNKIDKKAEELSQKELQKGDYM